MLVLQRRIFDWIKSEGLLQAAANPLKHVPRTVGQNARVRGTKVFGGHVGVQQHFGRRSAVFFIAIGLNQLSSDRQLPFCQSPQFPT